jgi:hypothetical protein
MRVAVTGLHFATRARPSRFYRGLRRARPGQNGQNAFLPKNPTKTVLIRITTSSISDQFSI